MAGRSSRWVQVGVWPRKGKGANLLSLSMRGRVRFSIRAGLPLNVQGNDWDGSQEMAKGDRRVKTISNGMIRDVFMQELVDSGGKWLNLPIS